MKLVYTIIVSMAFFGCVGYLARLETIKDYSNYIEQVKMCDDDSCLYDAIMKCKNDFNLTEAEVQILLNNYYL